MRKKDVKGAGQIQQAKSASLRRIPTVRADNSAKAAAAMNKANALGSNMTVIMQGFQDFQVMVTDLEQQVAALEQRVAALEAAAQVQ